MNVLNLTHLSTILEGDDLHSFPVVASQVEHQAVLTENYELVRVFCQVWGVIKI